MADQLKSSLAFFQQEGFQFLGKGGISMFSSLNSPPLTRERSAGKPGLSSARYFVPLFGFVQGGEHPPAPCDTAMKGNILEIVGNIFCFPEDTGVPLCIVVNTSWDAQGVQAFCVHPRSPGLTASQ